MMIKLEKTEEFWKYQKELKDMLEAFDNEKPIGIWERIFNKIKT